jgi:predicted SnoaL-like aldol condensation-catalyzing enzyme
LRSFPAFLALAATLALVACSSNAPLMRAARAQQNAAVALGFIDLAINRGEVDRAFHLYVAPGFREHDPRLGGDATGAALRRVLASGAAGLRQEVQHTVSQGDLVAVHSRAAHPDAAPAAAVSGGVAIVDLFRMEHGLIAEHWRVAEAQAGAGTSP